MALPTSPAVVVLENDVSIYTPNVQSSVVGIVGFADKGPLNKPTLATSQQSLVNIFGKPSTSIPGQGLEGALEILEATNQIYYVRAASGSAPAVASSLMGFSPAVRIPTFTVDTTTTSILLTLVNNDGVEKVTERLVSLASSTGITTPEAIVSSYFNPNITSDQDVFFSKDSAGNMYLASKYAGNNSLMTLSANSVTFVMSALDDNGDPSTIGSATLTASGGLASLSSASGLYLKYYSKYHGTGYNLSSLRDGSVQGISIEVTNKSGKDLIVVNSDGISQESFLVEVSPSSLGSVEYVLVNDDTNNQSDLIYTEIQSAGDHFTDVPDLIADKLEVARVFTFDGASVTSTPRFVKFVEGTFNLDGGNSGYSVTEIGNTNDVTSLIGAAADKTGIYALDDDSLNISIAVVPGIANQSVQNALITLAETSKNFVAVVSPPYGLNSAQEAGDWMNGRDTRTAAINSSWVAVYWPWVQKFNYYAAADEWYDPAIYAVRQMVFTDNVAEPWFAPAGYRRGRLTLPTDVEVVLNQGDRDYLYSNNVNPISKELQNGIVIFGQKTAQRYPSALDRVNVRRLMIYVRKVLLQLGKPFQFEPNDQFTWELVEDAVRPFIDDLKARRAIVEGDVRCDSTTNTPLRVDRNELWCSVTIKPTKAAETIVFEVNLTNQSATVNG